jgi:hypothetical protein
MYYWANDNVSMKSYEDQFKILKVLNLNPSEVAYLVFCILHPRIRKQGIRSA